MSQEVEECTACTHEYCERCEDRNDKFERERDEESQGE